MKILVTACNGDVGQAVVKSLRKDYTVVGCDLEDGVGRMFVSAFYVVDKPSANYWKQLNDIITKEKIDVIVPVSEPEIKAFGENVGNVKIPVVCQPAHHFSMFGHKYNCMTYLKQAGIPLVEFADGHFMEWILEFVGKHGFPVVCKQKNGYGSKGLHKINNLEELLLSKHKLNSPLVQQMMFGDEYSVGIFVDKEDIRVISFKRNLGNVGCSWKAETAFDFEVERYCYDIARVTKMQGAFNIQVIKTDHGSRLLEINPRFSSLTYARSQAGFEDAKWSVQQALGQKIDGEPIRYKKIKFQRYFAEMIDVVPHGKELP